MICSFILILCCQKCCSVHTVSIESDSAFQKIQVIVVVHLGPYNRHASFKITVSRTADKTGSKHRNDNGPTAELS